MRLALRPTFKFFNQEKTIFGKKVNFDMTKDLENQDWLKNLKVGLKASLINYPGGFLVLTFFLQV